MNLSTHFLRAFRFTYVGKMGKTSKLCSVSPQLRDFLRLGLALVTQRLTKSRRQVLHFKQKAKHS